MNKVAKVLKYGAIAFFIASFIGAIAVSNKKELTVVKAEYSWETDEYNTTTKFDGVLFFNSLLTSVVGCALAYGFGELIDIEDRKRRYLVLRFGEVDGKGKAASKNNESICENIDLSHSGYKLNELDSALRKAIEDHSLEAKGFQYDGVNESMGEYYFKVNRPELSKPIKIRVLIKKGGNNVGYIEVRSLTKDIDTHVEKEIALIKNSLAEHLKNNSDL